MNFVIYLIVGALLGWIGSIIMRQDQGGSLLLNVVVSIVGALLGGFLVAPAFGVSYAGDRFSLPGLIFSCVGAIILMVIVNLFRRGTVR